MNNPDVNNYLKQYIEKIERLEEEKSGLAQDIREVYAEAKANGLKPKIMRKIVLLRKMNKEDREHQEALLDSYQQALGMVQMSFEFKEKKGLRQTDIEEFTGVAAH